MRAGIPVAVVNTLAFYQSLTCLQVVAPHTGSPLTFATIEEFSVGTFKSMLGPDASPDVRQVRMSWSL